MNLHHKRCGSVVAAARVPPFAALLGTALWWLWLAMPATSCLQLLEAMKPRLCPELWQ